MTNYKDFLNEQLQNEKFKKEYDALDTSKDPLLKNRIIYSGSKIVEIAHKYSLLWGGEWSSNKKSTMHFSFIGDRNFKS